MNIININMFILHSSKFYIPVHQTEHAWQGSFWLRAANESVRACSLPTRYAEEVRIASGTSHYNSEKSGIKQMQRASWSSPISPQI